MMQENPFQDAEFNFGDMVYGNSGERSGEIGIVAGRWIEEVDRGLLFHYTVQYADDTRVRWQQYDPKLQYYYKNTLMG